MQQNNDFLFKELKNDTNWSHKKHYKVHFSDLDINGHVNNLTYLRWIQDTRAEFFTIIKMENDISHGFTVVNNECNYHKQMFYIDTAIVYFKVSDIRTKSIIVSFEIRNQSNDITATGKTILATYDIIEGKSCLISDKLRGILSKYKRPLKQNSKL
eukprot:TRINITY_DN5711_c0_g1_i1.p1 TRINITY_DN5711_c0_g1~~TRINITY_DN5711_c0_g1_i1.p1  ORF type:complete len:156 (-),score=17.43 TRINITY_DN5711_c0_g1_i1:139-606(-)